MSYPREAAGLGAAELQPAPLQRALPGREAAQGAAAVLQDVGQLGLQPLDGGSCHGRGGSEVLSVHNPTLPPSLIPPDSHSCTDTRQL